MKKTIFLFSACLIALGLASCGGNSTNRSDMVSMDSAANDIEESVAVEETPIIDTNWQYSFTEDKLNDSKDYYANVLSTDGKIKFQVGAIDLLGNGNHETILGFIWSNDLPSWNEKLLIGLKFPSDTGWRKIPTSCKGHSATFDIMIPTELVGLLKTNTEFSLLFGNEEFEFRPNAPLQWSHE